MESRKTLSFDTIKRGFMSGVNVTWELGKILVPIYFVVTFLKHTPMLDMIAKAFSPIMGIFGLPGEAAIALVLGNVVNLYASIGAIASLSLTVKELSILAIMLSFSHSLLTETALAKKIGLSGIKIVVVRVGLAAISGVIFNFIL